MSNLPGFDVLPKELRDKLLSDGSYQKDLLSGDRDEVPEDIRAFFGHPLTAATTALNGDDTHASALALLHEYQNLPAIDRTDLKIGDKFESLSDILQSETRKDASNDYMMLINTDIDAFLNRHDDSSVEGLGKGPLDDDSSHQELVSRSRTSPSSDLLLSQPHKPDTPSSTSSHHDHDFSVFSPAEPLELTTSIKQEGSPCSSTHCDAFLDALEAGHLMDTGHSLQAVDLSGPLVDGGHHSPPTVSPVSLSPIASNANEIVAHLKAPLVTGKHGVVMPPCSPKRTIISPVVQASPSSSSHPLSLQQQLQQYHQQHQQHLQQHLQQQHQHHQQQQQQQRQQGQQQPQQSTQSVDQQQAADQSEQLLLPTHDHHPHHNHHHQPHHHHNHQQQQHQQQQNGFSLQSPTPPHLSNPPPPPPLLHMARRRASSTAGDAEQPLSLVTTPKSMPPLIPVGQRPGDAAQQQKQQQQQSQAGPIHPPPPPPYQMHPHLPFLQLQQQQQQQQQQHNQQSTPPPESPQRQIGSPSCPIGGAEAANYSSPSYKTTPQKLTTSHSEPTTPCTAAKDLFPIVKTESEPASPKASDSTKKIIQAIHEKLRRNQLQKQASEPDGSMSYCDINNIIKESIEKEGGTVGAAQQNGGNESNSDSDSSATSMSAVTAAAMWAAGSVDGAGGYGHWQQATSPITPQPSPPQPTTPGGAPPQQPQQQQQLPKPHQQQQTPQQQQQQQQPSQYTCYPQEQIQQNYFCPSSAPSSTPTTPLSTSSMGPFSPRASTTGGPPRALCPPNATTPSTPGHTPGHTPATSPGPADRNMVLVISPQVMYNGGVHAQYPGGVPPGGGAPQHPALQGPSSYSDLKSPDSGFNESCVSPTDNGAFNDQSSDQSGSGTQDGVPGGAGVKAAKRRRSSSGTGSLKQVCTGAGGKSSGNAATVIEKVDPDLSGYRYILETNTSTSQRIEEDKITYLNKGQFYGLTLEYTPTNRILQCNTVKSIIVVLFRDERSVEDELQAWEFWHSRQHSIKQRILDIDTKNSSGILTNCIDEIAHNAVAIRWNPREQPAKVSIAINCLSTDFSNQKGVKGLPLHVQIDTYEEAKDVMPCHRGYCQVKVFCDKGAERKTRDEERRKEAKAKNSETIGQKKIEELYHPVIERSTFYTMADLSKQAILFNPVPEYEEYTQKGLGGLFGHSLCAESDESLASDDFLPGSPAKRSRQNSSLDGPREAQRVLLYVREGHEAVFTALLLHAPTLVGLAHAIEEKYNIPALKIKNIFKRSKKGLLVKMDDNIIRHYSNESTFVISIKKNEETHESQLNYDVTLVEIDPEAPQ